MEEKKTEFEEGCTIESLTAKVEKLEKELSSSRLDVMIYKRQVEVLDGLNVLLRLIGKHVYSL